MLRRVIYAALERKLNRAYKDRLAALGTVPKGVFWRNESTQIARFDALLYLVATVTPVANPTLCDADVLWSMLDFIQKTPRYQNFQYIGIDINRKISAVNKDFKSKTFVSVGASSILIFACFPARLIFVYYQYHLA